ncbi:uncharacterized protein [Miscanthus floridulus]|uniref:uncharacterized protein isoform X2 n=1 Tax=Miscanthus floridulus TaxID=154761 RepID=UPI003457E6EE
MAAAAASPPVPLGPEASALLDGDRRPKPAVAISWDSPERCEIESEACVIDSSLLPVLEELLQDIYAPLQPQPVDYEHRRIMINVFNKIAGGIFGKNNGLPIVEPFGSFTMDLFTPKSDLDLSINFNTDTNDQYPRRNKISAIRKLANVLFSHQRQGLCYGVSPIVTARVPVLKVTDQGTGVECDISVENKDGMSRSVIFKFISSIDERFRILCYLMKFWAKVHDVNCPKDRTMSSMAIISLVAFHLQTRRPPILPAFSAILKDGTDFASIEKNVSLFEGFGDSNKESIAELFVSLMSKLVSVEGLWEQGLCASNFEGSWISKTWAKGVGNLNVEDFLDRSQNFARSVGMKEMQKICECLRATVSDLSKFSEGKIAAPKLKALLFKPLNQANPVTNPRQKTVKRKRANPNKTSTNPIQKNAKKKKALEQDKLVISPGQKDGKKPLDQEESVSSPIQKDAKKTTPLDQDKLVISPGQKDEKKPLVQNKTVISPIQKNNKKPLDQEKPLGLEKLIIPTGQKDKKKSSKVGPDSGSSHVQQKKVKATVSTGRAANTHVSSSRPRPFFIPQAHRPTQPIVDQFAHIPQHLISPSAFGYGLPPPHLHPAYPHPHPHQGLVGQPQGNFLHFNPGIQLQHQGQAFFGPPSVHHPMANGFLHPFGINGAQQVQRIDNRLVQRPPYGFGPGFW